MKVAGEKWEKLVTNDPNKSELLVERVKKLHRGFIGRCVLVGLCNLGCLVVQKNWQLGERRDYSHTVPVAAL